MNCTTYTNSSTLLSAVKASDVAFHKRLQRLYPCVDDVSKLPQAWSSDSKAQPLGLTYDNLGCYFRGNGHRDEDDKSAAAIRTDHHIPPSCLLYYFEIKFISKGREGYMGIGLTPEHTIHLTKLPGWAREAYGYHGDDGEIFNGDGLRGVSYGPNYTTGDVVGCGLNLVEGKCFFTKNGLNLGKAFDDIPSNIPLYPTVGFKTPGGEIRANFGQEDFVYDIEQDLRSLRKNMTLTISNYPISDFSNWQNTLHKLVQSWLLQNSYPKTADAFTRSTKIECKENLQRIQQRNRIQQLVLSGRISEAIKLTNILCPNLLQSNPNLLFALKCRQFIELIGGAENDYQPVFNYANSDNSVSNGVSKVETSKGGDQPEMTAANHHPMSNNGCNGMVGDNNCQNTTTIHQQLPSSSSFQELMDVDQPMNSSTNSIDNSNNHNHHRNSATTNANNTNNSAQLHDEQQSVIKMEANGDKTTMPTTDTELDLNEQKFAKLLHFGRELSNYLQQLDKLYGKNEVNEKMLHEAISLIAFTNPKASCFGKLLDPSEREPISQLLNNSIVKAEVGDSFRSPLEEAMNHLRKLVRLNDSHGRWLVDHLY